MIADFWEWFQESEPKIRQIVKAGTATEQAWLKEQLDRYLLSIGKFSWEINKGDTTTYELVISPNRDHDLFKASRKIMEEAPALEHWTFLSSKKANPALEPFQLYDDATNLRSFTPLEWKVAKVQTVKGLEIQVESEDFTNCDLETALFAAEITLSSFLGEALFMEKVGSVVIGEGLVERLVDLVV